MSRPQMRLILVILLILTVSCFVWLLPSTTTSSYYKQLSNLNLNLKPYHPHSPHSPPPQQQSRSGLPGRSSSSDLIDLSSCKPNAKFVILVREVELNELMQSLKSLEDSFNSKAHAHYDYVILNNGKFSPHFEKMIRKTVSSKVEFGEILEKDWQVPDHIDMQLAREKWADMKKAKIPYADSKSYRQMCRYQSGKFYDHPLVSNLEYYWRVEPGVRFYCDLENFDPFRYMEQYKKKYGWVLALREYPATIRTLWPWVKTFVEDPQNRDLFLDRESSAWKFVTKDDGVGYNRCHFWSNFEIASLSLWRSEGYRKLFDFLDLKGGFFYSRWGDAPIHSIGASLLLRPEEIVQFDNIGYFHPPFSHCPRDPASKCSCDPRSSFDYDSTGFSCQREYDAMNGLNSSLIIEDIKRKFPGEVNAPPPADWLTP